MELRNRRVLVTGADGFIGSHLVERLVEDGASVLALAQYNSFNDWGWLESIPCLKDIEVQTGDIRDPHFCRELVRDVEVIFHLAALIPIPYSYRSPDSYVDTNIRGTLNICQAARANRVMKLIHTSTSEIYGTAQHVPMDETHPLSAQSPYSASKIGADAIAMSFFHSFELPVVIARPFNCYGPRQSARAVIPSLISQMLSGQAEIKVGNVTTTRDFTFVEDTSKGFAAVATMDKGLGEVFHIGSNNETSVREIAGLIAELAASDARIVTEEARMRPVGSEVFRLRCDNSKLKAASGFAPTVSLREGLGRTVEWFRHKENLRRYKGIYNV